MPMPRNEVENLEKVTRAFGKTSEDRQKIVKAMSGGDGFTVAEVAEATELEPKIARTRLTVMYRDKLVDYGDQDDQRYYWLTDKGLKRVA